MARAIRVAECVRLPDGRVGRVRSVRGGVVLVRVRRTTSRTHQLVWLPGTKLRRIDCPAGWMSPEGYRRYLRVTLAKMRARLGVSKRRAR